MGYYRYHGHGAHLSASLKQTIKRVRAAAPKMFAPRNVRESSMDGEGRVEVTTRRDVSASPISGAKRHALSHSNKWY